MLFADSEPYLLGDLQKLNPCSKSQQIDVPQNYQGRYQDETGNYTVVVGANGLESISDYGPVRSSNQLIWDRTGGNNFSRICLSNSLKNKNGSVFIASVVTVQIPRKDTIVAGHYHFNLNLEVRPDLTSQLTANEGVIEYSALFFWFPIGGDSTLLWFPSAQGKHFDKLELRKAN
jgi:hypothetical protein